MKVFMDIYSYYNVFYLRFFSENGGGGINLVYGSSSSSYMDCEVNFDYECYIFAGLGFV